jgi:hypothetical protein
VLTRTEVRTLTVEVTGHCRVQLRLWAKVPAVRVLGTCRSSSPARPFSAPGPRHRARRGKGLIVTTRRSG